MRWHHIKKLRDHIKSELQNTPQIKFYEGDPAISSKEHGYEVCVKSAADTCMVVPPETEFYMWWQIPRQNDLGVVKPAFIGELYKHELEQQPKDVCVIGSGLTALSAIEHFPHSNLTILHRTETTLPTHLPRYKGIDLSRVRIQALNKEYMTPLSERHITYQQGNSSISCELYDAIGFNRGDSTHLTTVSNRWNISECQWIAPTNVPVGSTLHSYANIAHADGHFHDDFGWFPDAFCKNQDFPNKFTQYLQAHNLFINPEFFNLLEKTIKQLDNPLALYDRLAFYSNNYHAFISKYGVNYEDYLKFINLLAFNVNGSVCPALHSDLIKLYMELATKLNISTPPSSAVFYSGGPNRGLADQFAQTCYWDRAANAAHNFYPSTVEMTHGGNHLDLATLFNVFSSEEAGRPWRAVSARYAEQASGKVYAFVQSANPNRTFCSVELPVLMKNPKVDEIVFLENTDMNVCGQRYHANPSIVDGKKFTFRKDSNWIELSKKASQPENTAHVNTPSYYGTFLGSLSQGAINTAVPTLVSDFCKAHNLLSPENAWRLERIIALGLLLDPTSYWKTAAFFITSLGTNILVRYFIQDEKIANIASTLLMIIKNANTLGIMHALLAVVGGFIGSLFGLWIEKEVVKRTCVTPASILQQDKPVVNQQSDKYKNLTTRKVATTLIGAGLGFFSGSEVGLIIGANVGIGVNHLMDKRKSLN